MDELRELENKGDYPELIKCVCQLVNDDNRIFTDPYIKEWCGRRWRNLFLQEAVKYEDAVKAATKKIRILKDKRPPVQKIAERFLRGDNLIEWKIEMPAVQFDKIQNTTLVFCPGLLNGLLPVRAFSAMFPAIVAKYGYKILRADTHPVRGCEANSEDILNTLNKGIGLDADRNLIAEADAVPPGDVVLMGYSKGAPDILEFLARYPEFKDRIKCIITWAGAIKGSFTADAIYEKIKNLPTKAIAEKIQDFLKMIAPVVTVKAPLRRFEEYDMKNALLDLTTYTRKSFLEQHGKKIDETNIPLFSFSGSTSITEVPNFQMADTRNLNKYDANNDMQLTQDQAKTGLPMDVHLSMLHAHHWDLSYDSFPKAYRLGSPNLDHPFPKEAAITALFKFLAELGLID